MTRVEAGDADADAALIDRLYGEPDIEGDDDLDGLRMVRGLIARVRVEDPDEEPPQAVSARLLQAAEALAPRPASAAVEPARPGVWARLRGWLSTMAAHPAMAAAATLVVVAGATALWMRGGGEVAEPTHQRDRGVEHAGAPLQEEAARADVGSGVVAAEPAPASDPEPAPEEPAAWDQLRRQIVSEVVSPETGRPRPRKPAGKPADKPGPGGGDVGGAAEKADAVGDDARAEGGGGATTNSTTIATGGAPAAVAPPAPPPAPPPASKKQADPPPAEAVAAEPEAVSGAELAAAYTRQAIAAAKKGNCQTVDQLAAKAKAADAGYYQRSFVTQADIKKCLAKKSG